MTLYYIQYLTIWQCLTIRYKYINVCVCVCVCVWGGLDYLVFMLDSYHLKHVFFYKKIRNPKTEMVSF